MTDSQDPTLGPDIKFQLVRKFETHKVIGLAGPELLEHEKKYLEFHGIPGVILFWRNVESFSQLRELIDTVNERIAEDGRPALIMADHEGDFVSVLRRLIGIPPSALALAATADPSLAYDVAHETGHAMAKLGVNTVLAPVADLYLDPRSPVTGIRTFGRDADAVGEFVAQTVSGFRDAGLIACVKHYPGHGQSPVDSHEALPVIEKTLDDLRAADLVPFARAIEAGVDMVMTAHVAYTLDTAGDRTPASFDSRLIEGVLRNEMGFDGAVITDALEMESARAHVRGTYGGLGGGFERTLLAGTDVMLYTAPVPERMQLQEDGEGAIAVEVMQTIIETLHKVVDRSRIERKLEEAAAQHEGLRNMLAILQRSEARIDALRKTAAVLAGPPVEKPAGNVIRLGDYASTPGVYKDVAERAIVLMGDPASVLPIDTATACTVLPIEYRFNQILMSQDLTGFLEGLCRTFPAWRVAGRVTGFEPDVNGMMQPVFGAPERQTIMDAQRATGAAPPPVFEQDDVILPVVSARAAPPEDFAAALHEFVMAIQAPLVIVTGGPVIDWVPEGVTCIATLGASPQVGAATGAVLAGQAEATGSLDGIL